MARNDRSDRRRSARPVYRTNGAAAYDVRYSPRELEYGGAARRYPEPERKPRSRPRSRLKPKAKLSVSPLAVAGMLAVAFMLVFVMCGYVQLYEETAAVADLQDQIEVAQEYHGRLQAIYDSKVDLDAIGQRAAALGMTEPNSRQTILLNLQGTDRAVITGVGSENVVQTAWNAIVRSVRTLKEYFS